MLINLLLLAGLVFVYFANRYVERFNDTGLSEEFIAEYQQMLEQEDFSYAGA